jgi:archaellin
MRILKVLLLTLTLALFAAPAWGDGAPDPTIYVQPGHGSTPTDAGASASDPIFVTDNSITDWLLDSSAYANNTSTDDTNTNELFVEVIPGAGESEATFLAEVFNCVTDPPTTTACGFVAAQGTNGEGGIVYPAVEAVFEGPFYQGEDITISVTPEPGTALLLFVGVAVFLAYYGLRKRQAILA